MCLPVQHGGIPAERLDRIDGVPTPRVRVALRRKGLQMFKVGKTYKFWVWEDSHDGGIVTARGSCKVTKVDMPLVTIDQAGTETIINTHSPTFSRAEPEKMKVAS